MNKQKKHTNFSKEKTEKYFPQSIKSSQDIIQTLQWGGGEKFTTLILKSDKKFFKKLVYN